MRKAWHIIEVPGIASGSIKNKIEFKIPGNFKRITGMFFSAVDAETVDAVQIYAFEDKGSLLGKISLHLNDKEINPVQYMVHLPRESKLKYELMNLDEELEGGAKITGYFIDNAAANKYPYKLKIYLKGERKEC